MVGPLKTFFYVRLPLDILGGGHFHRTEGVCSNSATSTAHNMTYTFVDALLTLKPDVVCMPNRQRKEANADKVYTKHKLFNVIYGIDGCHIPFAEKPRLI